MLLQSGYLIWHPYFEIMALSLLRKFPQKLAEPLGNFFSLSDEHIFTIKPFWNVQIYWMT